MPKRTRVVPTYVGTLGSGFTLIELLIVISIIMMLLVFVLINMRAQIDRANDAKRKNDVYILKNVIEEYRNDKNVFPPEGAIADCGSANLSPYIQHIPCDPQTRNPYGYFPSVSTGGYRVCAKLLDLTDPAIAAMGCSGPSKCGVGGGYNYCLVSGTTASAVGTQDEIFEGGATATPFPPGYGEPTPTPNPTFHFACGGDGICRSFDTDPTKPPYNCPWAYPDATCNNDCPWVPSARCP